jgi:hypothetical protein
MRWWRGHVGKFWDDSYKNFPYIRQPITDDEVKQWIDMGYDCVKSFTGVMYDNRNPMPKWIETFECIFPNYGDLTYTFYKMQTLEIMPVHSDHYNTYRRIYGVESKNVLRILVMLEDWKPGHYLEVEGTGIVNWIAGDYFVWRDDCPHAASNIGIEDRYTLQITCTEIKSEDIWQKLHWYNIPDLPTKTSSYTNFLQDRIVKHVPDKDTEPFMIYLYNERIKELKKINHDEQTIAYLNEKGLDIYLYEPLCSYVLGKTAGQHHFYDVPKTTRHTLSFYSEFKGDEDPTSLRADELDSILEYKDRNKLKVVRVHTCDYDVEKNYPHYVGKIQLYTDDLFLKSINPINTNFVPTSNFQNRFICMNWRWAPHRHLIAAFMTKFDCKLSWYFRSAFDNIAKSFWYDLYQWSEKYPDLYTLFLDGLKNLNEKAPYNLDLDIIEPVTITHPYHRQALPNNTIINVEKEKTQKSIEDIYSQVFCDIVTETRFAQPTANYSEKVYNPMFYRKPFILLAPPKTLQYLRENGFKTFSDFWDESYDDILDHEQRFVTIVRLIQQLNDTPLPELQIMYDNMTSILEHNFELVNKKTIPVKTT